jgi:predicted HAD superfamily Cof-like phosphohydrolase
MVSEFATMGKIAKYGDLDWSKRVARWNEAACVPRHSLEDMPCDEMNLAVDLIREEVNEMIDAIFLRDKIEAADGAGDSIVVILGAMYRLGIDMAAVMDEILRSNDSKLIGGVERRKDGKIMKGANFVKPDIEGALERGRKL